MNKQEELKATMEAQAAEARLLEMVRREVSDSEARIIRLMKAYADDCKYTTQPIKPDLGKPVPVENMAGMTGHVDRSKLHRAYEITEDRLSECQRFETGFRNIVTILVGARTEFEIKDIVEKVRKLHEVTQKDKPGVLLELNWVDDGKTLCIFDGASRAWFTREEAGKIVQFLLNTRCEIRL